MPSHNYMSESTGSLKNRLVMAGAASKSCKTPTGANVPCVGISEDDLVDTESASIVDQEGEHTVLEMSENCANGDEIKCAGTTGKGAVAETNATPENQYIEAIAREANTGGDTVCIKVRRVHYSIYQ